MLRGPVLLLVALALSAARAFAADGCASACPAAVTCKRTECGTLTGPARRRCVEQCRERHSCAARIRKLAYAVSRCRVDAAGIVGEQRLDIVRGGCEPRTIVHFITPTPVAIRSACAPCSASAGTAPRR